MVTKQLVCLVQLHYPLLTPREITGLLFAVANQQEMYLGMLVLLGPLKQQLHSNIEVKNGFYG